VAIEVSLLLQTPPETLFERLVVPPPAQMMVIPDIVPALGSGITVNAADVMAVPQLLV
jgi:hypothetical protein